MQHSEQPYLELERARQAMEAMRKASSLEVLEEAWKDYLRRLERTWNKSVNHFGKSPKWNGWQGRYLKLRKNDPLLAYFINARGADEHTVSEITQRHQGGTALKTGSDGGPVFVEKMTIVNGQITELKGTGFYVEFSPAHVALLPITNRGVEYPVPTTHLSQPINPQDLLDVAEKGVRFYADFLEQAEEFFIQPSSAKK